MPANRNNILCMTNEIYERYLKFLNHIQNLERKEKVQLGFGDQLKRLRIKDGQRNIMTQIQKISHLVPKLL